MRRREGIDVARITALVVVVAGHLLLAVVDTQGGEIRAANLISLHPGLVWLAALAPMPVFFAAGGWANATATPQGAAPRLRALIGAAAAVVAIWSTLVVVASASGIGVADELAKGARLATQPLWFLAAYVPMAAYGRTLARLVQRHLVAAIVVVLGGLALLDWARFVLHAPDWVGWPGFFLAWGAPWLLGAWWRGWSEGGGTLVPPERRVGACLLVGAAGACLMLVALCGYSPGLIDAVPDARSNTTPPTLYTAVAGLAQVGLLMLIASRLDRAGRRWRGIWSRAGEAAAGVYVWHLTGLAVCVGAVAAGVPVPERLTWSWWLTRPLWWAVALVVTLGCTAATAGARRWLASQSGKAPPSTTSGRVGSGVAAATVGAAVVGLYGPKTAPMAVACSGLLVAAWRLLGCRAKPRRSSEPATTAGPGAGTWSARELPDGVTDGLGREDPNGIGTGRNLAGGRGHEPVAVVAGVGGKDGPGQAVVG